MIANIVANYLVNKGKISLEQYVQLFEELKKVRARLGLIAVHEGFITEYQADTINLLQSTIDMKFGDLAVEKGMLTESQVKELLKHQGDPYLSLAQAFENMGIMKLNDLDLIMKKYQAENELSTTNLEALKSDEIDRIVPLFLPPEADDYIDIAILTVKTISRCVNSNIIPIKAYFTNELEIQNGALQYMDGTPGLTLAICGDGNSLLEMARIYGQEEFESVDMDALDAIAELINCVNGMYATALSARRIALELYPPSFDDSAETIGTSKMLVLPLVVGSKSVNICICLGERLEFK